LEEKNTPGKSFREYQPFAFNPTCSQQPTIFKLNFLLKGIRYRYHVGITAEEVVQEQLYYYPNGRETKLFNRDAQVFDYGDSLKGAKVTIEKLTAKNQLYLSKAALNNLEQLVDVYLYFKQDFMPIPFLDFWNDSYYINRLAKELEESPDHLAFVQNFKSLLRSFDTGIVDFRVKAAPFQDDYEIEVEHHVYDDRGNQIGSTFQPFEEESTGTQKLFVIGGLILRALMNGRVIMIDEFERSLHPFISSLLFRIFNHSKVNTENAQLIIATHDTTLLAKEQQLTRDQIWIVEKDKTGSTELYTLSDMEGIRKNIPFEKWYLTGRLGGIPNIESLNFEYEMD
jgi:AAA15 family ATPase/GTPase